MRPGRLCQITLTDRPCRLEIALSVGDCTLWLFEERFVARLQLLMGCLPDIWILRAREDVDHVNVCMTKTADSEQGLEMFEDLAPSVGNIIADFYGGLIEEFIYDMVLGSRRYSGYSAKRPL